MIADSTLASLLVSAVQCRQAGSVKFTEPVTVIVFSAPSLNKSHPATQRIPVILISAVAHLEKITADCKADNYIKKPFDLQDLSSLVNSYLRYLQ